MDALIADFILSNGLQPSLRECPKLKFIIEGEKYFPNWHDPTTRNFVSGPLLDENHTKIINKIDSQLMKESEVFRLIVFGDSTTMLYTPFINVLA